MAKHQFIRKTLFESRIREAADKALFVVAFLAGIAGILIAKFNNANPFLISGGVIVLMLLYVVICWFTRIARIREDVIGDNVYYLGFLFTLASLAFALYQLNTIAERELIINSLLSNFGVALSSTIAGIFLRVFINQFRVDPVEIEREVRAELIDASTQLRTNLHSTIAQFNTLRTEMSQIVRESVELSVTKHAEAMRAMSEAVATEIKNLALRLTTDLDKPISDARTDLGGTVEHFSQQTAIVNSGLQEFSRELKSGSQLVMRSFTDAAKRLDTSSQNYAVKLESTGTKADALMEQFAGQLERITKQASTVLDGFGSISRAIEQLRDDFSAVSRQQLTQLSTTTENSLASSRTLSDTLTKVTGDAAVLRSAIQETSHLIAQAKEAVAHITPQSGAGSMTPASPPYFNPLETLPDKTVAVPTTRDRAPPTQAPTPQSAAKIDPEIEMGAGQPPPRPPSPRQDPRSWWRPFKRN